MAEVLVLQNQNGDYLSKQREWLSAGDSKTLFRSVERDEIINEKVELTVKNPELRVSVVTVTQEDNGRLTLDGKSLLKKLEPPVSDETENGAESEPDLIAQIEAPICSE